MPEAFRQGRAWIELDRGNLRHNVEVLSGLMVPGCRLMPAVKANAYGHGAVPVARELNALGVTDFCVASAEEGAELRRAGITGDMLVLGYTDPGDFGLLERYDLIQTVVDSEYAGLLAGYGRKLRVHIKIDTGMHRLGERCENSGALADIFAHENLCVEGAYTHLSADDNTSGPNRAFTEAQAERFRCAVGELEKRGFSCGKTHLLASSGLLKYPELGGSYARVGIALYGVLSSREDLSDCPAELRPVLSLKARIAGVKEVAEGENVGYGLETVAARPLRIAVLAIGYADGLPRALSNGRGRVLIGGRIAPVIGRICMDQTIVDVTDVPEAAQGGTAVIIGRSGGNEITAYDLAEQCGTITNEILSRMGSRLERITV